MILRGSYFVDMWFHHSTQLYYKKDTGIIFIFVSIFVLCYLLFTQCIDCSWVSCLLVVACTCVCTVSKWSAFCSVGSQRGINIVALYPSNSNPLKCQFSNGYSIFPQKKQPLTTVQSVQNQVNQNKKQLTIPLNANSQGGQQHVPRSDRSAGGVDKQR